MALAETKPALRSFRIVEAKALARASAVCLNGSPLLILPFVIRPRRASTLVTVVRCQLITAQDQIAELKTRVVLVRFANIERMKLMYAPELSGLPEPPRNQFTDCVGRVDQFRKLGPDTPLPRPFGRSCARCLAVRDRPDAASGRIRLANGFLRLQPEQADAAFHSRRKDRNGIVG
jgi:hypothetical protein